MAQDGPGEEPLLSSTATSLKNEAVPASGPAAHAMQRTFSQDIQEGTQELKIAAEQTRNIILDLGLDGVIRWVSPSWTDIVKTELDTVKGKPISQFISDNPAIFDTAISKLQSNDSKSQFVRFKIKMRVGSDLSHMLPEDEKRTKEESDADTEPTTQTLGLEGQGIMVYDRPSGGESHTMWMLQPAADPITIELPGTLVDSLGIGAEVLAKHLTELAESGANDPENHPPPMPILCRICERDIVPWWFEKHSDLCVQEHKAEMECQMIQENLTEQRNAIVKVLDAFEARNSRSSSAEHSPALLPRPEYKGVSIGPASTPSSGTSSHLASNTASPNRSRSPSSLGLGHARSRSSFAPRRPLTRIVELILDLCDTAIEINPPAIKETKSELEEDFRTQSPQSESRISQVLSWQQPSSLENEPGLAQLSLDTERLAKSKVEAIHRHQVILEYSERIRQETIAEVDACIAEALHKAERLALGESLSSGESDVEHEELEAEGLHEEMHEEPIPMQLYRPSSAPDAQLYVGVKAMAKALRSTPELPTSLGDERRTSSVAVSTRSNSPMECPTPKSHKSSSLIQPQPTSNRRSLYLESDANDSDSSIPSSILSNQWRTDSPSSDQVLSRATSSRDRDRKRRSMHLHGLGSGSPRRHQSPGRYPQPPPSPLRMTKSRVSSGDQNVPSPIVSPLLTTGEYMNSQGTSQHHRRQSSVHLSHMGGPQSPRMSSINQPQARVQPPSIKDFEIIKPISRGAFGSVYLSKKKLTGEYFAIKTLRKTDMVAKNQVSNVKAERAIMMWQGESDFVAKLYWTFSSKEHLFLVMEYLNGGDCASLVKILGGLSEDWAKKYIAEVVLGVEHLHGRGIVHRDLKPDNLLIDSKGHLKLTDFGLSRMGLVGRQKRALEIKSPEDSNPDLLKQGPFMRSTSGATSRSASFDYHGAGSPSQTPLMTPALANALDQPSYFSLNRENSLSRERSRRTSGNRSDSGSLSTSDLHRAFRAFSIHDPGELPSNPLPIPQRGGSIEEESYSAGSASPDLFPISQSVSNIVRPHSESTSQMLPPPMALFDPEDSKRRFVGTPDYLAPETISGSGQDEMSDWWSLGCILFEFLYGYPPFNADTQEEVFENILHRRIHWPDSEDDEVVISEEARDLINKLVQLEPHDRLGANLEDKYSSGGAEIQAHPWFSDINWDTLLEDEAQFVPNPENPEDTEYFDARGATLQTFPEEMEDQLSPALTPGGSELGDRPHDALFRARNQAISGKRGLMPLHIPPHVARDSRSRRLSEPVIADDFGNFTFKNLPVLEKANKDIVDKMRKEAMQAQIRGISSQAVSISNSPAPSSPAGALEGSPMLPMPVKRAISISKGHRPASPSGLGNLNSSPIRPVQPSLPSSPLLVQFSTHQHHERRKTSSSSHTSSGHGSAGNISSGGLQPGNFFELPKDANGNILASAASSPIKHSRMSAVSPAKTLGLPQRQNSMNSRTRSQTVGSQDGDLIPRPEGFVPGHYKRRSQLFAQEVSPSSSDTENTTQAQALLKVRKRQSLRRMSQINLMDGPMYRPLDILICEDHPVSKMVMERLFEKLRCRTITASNGPEGLRLAVSQIQFDIIFMEYRLPLINGVDVSRMIRDTKSANTQTPIVCMTGYLRDLPSQHHFDTLIQKPPTVVKLKEALEKFCSWKEAPKDIKFTSPLVIPQSVIPHNNTRYEAYSISQDSPSSIASSQAPTMPDSSWKSSSREDSIGSSVFSDFDSIKADDTPSIVSRPPTDEWGRESGLGISHDIVIGQKPYIRQALPRLIHTESAPTTGTATAPAEQPPHMILGVRTPRKQRSIEAIKAKRESLEKKLVEGVSAESGDDEDEELGRVTSRGKSPFGRSVRTSSKLGQEMMRTNSRGSVISTIDDSSAESANLRKSLEILEERMEGLRIPEEPDQAALLSSQPRKMERTASQHSHPEPEGLTPERPESRGHITPPIIFPQQPGDAVKEIDMDHEITPMPTRTMSIEDEELTLRPSDFVDEPTPPAQASPARPSPNT